MRGRGVFVRTGMRTPPLVLAALLAAGCSSSAQRPAPEAPPRTPTARTAIAEPEPAVAGDLAGLVMRLYAAEYAEREAAARDLGAMGAAAAAALPELIICAATEPFEGGSRDGDLDPGYLADAEPVEACAGAIAAISAEDPAALVSAMTVPLATKRAALGALGAAGEGAIPGLAAVYLAACERGATATNDGAVQHLRVTAAAALDAMAVHPGASIEALAASDGDCAAAGVERIRRRAGH
jgi:hypothetical protein